MHLLLSPAVFTFYHFLFTDHFNIRCKEAVTFHTYHKSSLFPDVFMFDFFPCLDARRNEMQVADGKSHMVTWSQGLCFKVLCSLVFPIDVRMFASCQAHSRLTSLWGSQVTTLKSPSRGSGTTQLAQRSSGRWHCRHGGEAVSVD